MANFWRTAATTVLGVAVVVAFEVLAWSLGEIDAD
jgi:hypothetical protein